MASNSPTRKAHPRQYSEKALASLIARTRTKPITKSPTPPCLNNKNGSHSEMKTSNHQLIAKDTRKSLHHLSGTTLKSISQISHNSHHQIAVKMN
jgi:hypothetical protein